VDIEIRCLHALLKFSYLEAGNGMSDYVDSRVGMRTYEIVIGHHACSALLPNPSSSAERPKQAGLRWQA